MNGVSGPTHDYDSRKTVPTQNPIPHLNQITETIRELVREPVSWVWIGSIVIATMALFYAIYAAATIAGAQQEILDQVRRNERILDERTEKFSKIEAELKRVKQELAEKP